MFKNIVKLANKVP